MKPKQLFGVLLLLVGTILSGCRNDYPDYPYGFMYVNQIHIDSTAFACGIDSCVINTPWMQNEINTFLIDSAERKQNFVSSLKITQYLCLVDTITNEDITYFECTIEDNKREGTLWFNCNGDTIWIDPEYHDNNTFPTKTETYFGDSLWYSGVIKDKRNIVKISIGLIPNI